MEQKDLIISNATEKIENELERLEKELKPNGYIPKTNCRFSFNEKSNDSINIRTVNDASELVKIMAFIKRKFDDYNKIKSMLEMTVCGVNDLPEFTWNGFSNSDWFDDITFFIRKLIYNKKVKELTEYKKTLEPLYSQDKKDQIVIESILSKLNF